MASQSNHIRTGLSGEDSAVAFLRKSGYKIHFRNYRYKRAEIDIIAEHNGVLVFVEVKTRSSDKYGFPEESVNWKKERLLLSAAENYIYHTQWEHDIRFDIISITLGEAPAIYHIQDAFH